MQQLDRWRFLSALGDLNTVAYHYDPAIDCNNTGEYTIPAHSRVIFSSFIARL